MSYTSGMTPPARAKSNPLFLAAAAVLIVAAGGWSVAVLYQDPKAIPVKDFVEYWSAGVVTARGGNPYDAEQLLPYQVQAGHDPNRREAVMMWNPPWALAVVVPLGLLPPRAAHLTWLGIQMAAVLASAGWLWRVYGGPKGMGWVAALVALFFAPFFLLMWYGQIGSLCLVGLAGFVYSHARGRPAAAGAFAALTALKPHLLFAFGVALGLDALATRRGRIALLAGAAAVAAAGAVVWAVNPDVYRHYREAMGKDASTAAQVQPRDWMVPLASYWLRVWVAPHAFWVQFVPTAVTAVAVAGYWFARRRTWDWAAELPRLVFASVLTAAYGAWIFDLIVLLVPVLQATVWLAAARRPAATAGIAAVYAVLNVATVAVPLWLIATAPDPAAAGFGIHHFIYFSPATFLLYLAAGRVGATGPRLDRQEGRTSPP